MVLYKVNKMIYLLYISIYFFFTITLLDLTFYNDEPKPE